MKMPEGPIDGRLFAPCGMNCLVCYKHCAHKKPCAGCLWGDAGKPGHCRRCKIKECARGRGLTHCHACPEHPCKQIKALDKSYRTRYGASLVENSRRVRALGVAAFMAQQREQFACPQCSGVLSLHDGACSECGWKVPAGAGGGLPGR